jgi:hypothetical protein
MSGYHSSERKEREKRRKGEETRKRRKEKGERRKEKEGISHPLAELLGTRSAQRDPRPPISKNEKNQSTVETLIDLHATIVFTVVRKAPVRILRNLVVSLFLTVDLARNVRGSLTLRVTCDGLITTGVLVHVSNDSLDV